MRIIPVGSGNNSFRRTTAQLSEPSSMPTLKANGKSNNTFPLIIERFVGFIRRWSKVQPISAPSDINNRFRPSISNPLVSSTALLIRKDITGSSVGISKTNCSLIANLPSIIFPCIRSMTIVPRAETVPPPGAGRESDPLPLRTID